MLIIFLLLGLIPLAWALLVKFIFHREIHWLEMIGVFLVGVLVISAGLGISYNSQLADVEVLNGKVTGKDYQDVSCKHSYECNCRMVPSTTTSQGKTTTTYQRVCDTCYEHSFDREWWVRSNVGSSEIDSVSRQGLKTPPRWTSAVLGEPYAGIHPYRNYVLGSRNTLFQPTPVLEKMAVPTYGSVYDYYRYDHVRGVDVVVPNLTDWNAAMAEGLRDLGSHKQVNINILFTKSDRVFGEALELNWVGGKKNDVNIVVGTKQWPKVDWVHVFTYARSSGNALTTIQLRDEIQKPEALVDAKATSNMILQVVRDTYKRKPMKDFEYLAEEVTPSVAAMIAIILILIAALAVTSYFFLRNDLRQD